MRKTKAQQELKGLFGEPVASLAQMSDPAMLELSAALMDRVHEGADALLTLHGHRDKQRRYIKDLPFNERLVLCMWLMDTDLASKLMRAVYAKG